MKLLFLFSLAVTLQTTVAHGPYLMYVWDDAFDITKCDLNEENYQDDNCFSKAFDTPEGQSKLLGAATVPGREVGRILLSKVSDILDDCPSFLVDFLREAHGRGIEVYALFAVSNEAFGEKERVLDVVSFNANCATTEDEKFDGVAVNNEFFTKVKCKNEEKQRTFLDNLHQTRQNAQGLPLHFSVSWHWGHCSVSRGIVNSISWGPEGATAVTKSALEHMYDIADSVDVQVAWSKGSTMRNRAQTAGYQYFEQNHPLKDFFVLAYVNYNTDCRLSFFPTTEACRVGDKSEAGMWAAFDVVEADLPLARGGIHYYGGVYAVGSDEFPAHPLTS